MVYGDHVPDASEQAALYAAGALPTEEAVAFERRLAEGEESAIHELARLDGVMSELLRAYPPVVPDGGVRARLLGQLTPGVYVQRGEEAVWQEIGVPGLAMRVLYRDRERGVMTFLLRMEPGAILPGHPHPGVEECYVVEGDVETQGIRMRAGDYFRADAGTQHGVSRTEGGCVMLLQGADVEG